MFGDLHEKFVQYTPLFLRSVGEYNEATIIEENMQLLKSACKSPDNDYPEYKIPDKLIPSWMSDDIKSVIKGTSIAKWEHTYPLDIPKEVSEFIKIIAEQLLKIPYRYANTTILDWFNKAVYLWTINRSESLNHIGRCCHLVQDVSVPVHIAVSGNFKDVYNVFTRTNPNHKRFEQYCSNVFTVSQKKFELKELKISEVIKEIALNSKEYLKYCDGISLPNWTSKIMSKWLFKFLGSLINDDYQKAAIYTNESAQKYTVLLFHTFFKTVGI
jgi:hypothetical protein